MFRWILIAILATGCVEWNFQPSEETDMSPKQSLSGGWSKSGSLFTRDTIFVDPVPPLPPGPPIATIALRELSMQANFPDAGYYTVQFSVASPPGIVTAPDVTAEIVWSVEGNAVRRTMSVGNGSTISGTGQACRVTAKDSTIFGPGGIEYPVSILVSPGTRPSKPTPPFLRAIPVPGSYIVSLVPGALIDIPVPNDSGAISVDVEVAAGFVPPGIAPDEIVVLETDLSFIPLVYKAYHPLIDTGFVPLFPSTKNIRVQNNSAATTVFVSCLFGIDG